MKAEDIKPGMKLRIVKDPGRGFFGGGEVGRVVTAVQVYGGWQDSCFL